MALYHRNGEKKRIAHDFRRQEEEVIGSLCRLGSRPISPKTQLEQEKRIRREIANSNERRRMQSINAGFQSLRTLLPHHEGEKLSKAAILQHTAEYIYQLEQEKTRLLTQNCHLKRLLSSQTNHDSDGSCSDSPLPKRKKTETVESSDEGIGSMSPSENEPVVHDVQRDMLELRAQLDRERKLRLLLEQHTRALESQLYPEHVKEITQQIQLQYLPRNGDDPVTTLLPSVNMVLETGLTSPQSQLSSEDVESSQEMSLVEATPERAVEVPQDLSGKNCNGMLPDATEVTQSLPQISSAEVASPVLTELTAAVPMSPPASGVDPVTTVQTPVYSASTSRQNLETIVEAIRHLEGDHLFRDDPVSSQDECLVKTEQNMELQSSHSCISGEFAIRHQIIQSAPISQSRPGVIVTNHS